MNRKELLKVVALGEDSSRQFKSSDYTGYGAKDLWPGTVRIVLG